MGLAVLGPHRFRLDPSSVSWQFTIKTNAFETIGGRVVQVYGTDIGDMTVTGSFGVGGYTEQLAFLESMRGLGENQAITARATTNKPPLHFLYPPRKWDFLVYLKDFSQGGGESVQVAPDNVAIPWTLTLFIVEDNSNVKKVAQDAYIARLAAGLGWKLTDYNGPNASTAAAAVNAEGGVQNFILHHTGVVMDGAKP
jgi:hypothetical protein